MTTTSKKTKTSKPSTTLKPLSPRKDPKGGLMFFPVGAKGVRQGGGGGCDDEFGCSGNHNQVVLAGCKS